MSYAKKQYRFKQHYLVNEMKRKEVTKNGKQLLQVCYANRPNYQK